MAELLASEFTSFTLDNMGRYLCNTLQEALDSAGQSIAGNSRGFDVIIAGGGTFGSAIAQRLFARDGTRSRRILVLEAGPFVLPEHVQNMAFMGGEPGPRRPWVSNATFGFPGLIFAIGGRSLTWGGWSPESLKDARNNEMVNWPASVVNALKTSYFLEASDQIGVTATNDFIHGPLHEGLRKQLFDGLQAGSGLGGPFASLPLGDLPDHPVVRSYQRDNGAAPPDALLREWLKLPPTDTTPRAELLNLLKLEAPLAVQSVTEPGQFPFNKFSAIPLVTQAARLASTEADGVGIEADARKRLMVVPNCHVQELVTETQADNWVRVVGVRALDQVGDSQVIPLAPPRSDGTQSAAIIALGTIESTRLALTTFKDSLAGRAAQRMGRNLIAHLRSNFTIRIPREALTSLPAAAMNALQVSALFVKGKASIGGVDRYFHLQITASGLSALGNNSEAELFKKIPDIDQVLAMMEADDTTVVITLRGIGEMAPNNPDSKVELAQFDFDFQRPAAFVDIGNAKAPAGGSSETQSDRGLWEAMDTFTDEAALIFAAGMPFEILADKLGKTIKVPAGATANDLKTLLSHDNRRDGLGTTHHEAGTLWMSDNAADGVTNDFGRVHDTTNCYVVGPALFPSSGSPNPMLGGIALARRTADLLTDFVLPRPASFTTVAPFRPLFDGTGVSFNRWSRVSPGSSNGFALINGDIVTYGNRDFGLLYYAAEAFADFTLRVQFRIFNANHHNSGIFVRFRDPMLDLTPVILTRIINEQNQFGNGLQTDFQLFQANRAWSAVHSGFEIQIDDNAVGDPRRGFYANPEPNGLRKNRTGAIYKIPAKDAIPNSSQLDAELQVYQAPPNFNPGTWYEFEIDVQGNTFTVDLTNLNTGQKTRTTTFVNTDAARGVAMEDGEAAGYIGLQSYPGAQLAFRHIQIKT
ncbi:MAG: family 16 glycoside hydrolase [Candidatus Entotheonellia bacterium]